MSKLYFAKININSKIYDLYENEDKSEFQKILYTIFQKIDVKHSYQDEDNIEYKFNSIEKDVNELIITGRLSKIYDGYIESYDRKQDKPKHEGREDLSSTSTFCFDVQNEIVAFTRASRFGHNQFAKRFNDLLSSYFEDLDFETIIIQNIGDFKRRVDDIKTITKVCFTLIPPNPPNKEEFMELFGDRADDVLETRGTKYQETLEISKKDGEGINRKSKFFGIGYNAVNSNYGNMSVHGYDYSNNEATIVSEEQAPYVVDIDENKKDEIPYLKENGINNIRRIIADMIRKK